MRSLSSSLRIIHVLRAPEGGLFRHVLDLADEQARRGHDVGVVADSLTGGEAARTALAAMAPGLALGVHRLPMRRRPDPRDLIVLARLYALCLRLKPDVLHGHGAKGGVFARLTGALPGLSPAVTAYTPHGGAFHPQPGHELFMRAERILGHCTDLLLFESDFLAREYAAAIGPGRALRCVAKNGLRPFEFQPAPAAPDAADFVAIGTLRREKGVDLAIRALALLPDPARLAVVGAGPELCALKNLAQGLGLGERVRFFDPMPGRAGFALGRIVIAPSRAESLPYLALEAVAAEKQLLAADVGGVGEIFGAEGRAHLVGADDVPALAQAMSKAMFCAREAAPDWNLAERRRLARHVRAHFNLSTMANRVLGAYREAIARKRHILSPEVVK